MKTTLNNGGLLINNYQSNQNLINWLHLLQIKALAGPPALDYVNWVAF
jgi:hypothetical protein